MWLKLYKLNNCFNDKNKTHLGLKYKNKWYAITHLDNNTGSLIPKKFLKMGVISEEPEYLKRILNSAPNIVSNTKMLIHERILEKYDEYKLDNLKNKRKRHNEGD